MVLDGDLRAAAGLPGYYGGSLSVDLTRTLRVNPTSSVPPYPTSPATILIQQAPTTLLPASAGFGSALDTPTYDGKVLLSATELSGSGIDSLSLQADSAIAFTGVAPVNLSLAREVLFNSPTISVSAQTPSAAVSAPALTFSSIISAPGSAATPGTASFTARGENIDLAGATVFAGIGTLTLASSGDIRLLGVKGSGGALSSSGSLELDAQRIYPESLTSFSISVADAPSGAGSIRIGRNGATGSVDSPLSAGGQLTLTASTIDQEGVLQAPLGSIALNATDALHLGPNSITSVHLSGSDVLLGSTVNQTNWYYSFFGADALNTNDQLFGPNAQSFPSKQISLNGASVSVDGGAVVDLSGGGDVLAYEQIPGPGGRLDILSLSHAGSMFAVLPLQAGYGPIDPSEFAGWTLPAGSAVTLLQGADGLSAGTYAILPPRYALLPGAFLITPTSGFANMDPGKTVALADGGIVVPGFDSTIDSGLRSANVSGFIVHPGSYAYQLAQYAITSANTYLPKLAGQLGVNVPQLPLDAGTLDVTGQSALRLGGSFITAPATGGQGAQVNISAQNIEVVTALDQSPAVAEISASDLNNLGAASILLGGTRSAGSKGTTLDVTADSVTLGPGVALSVPQLILIATDNVNLGAGSSVTASGAGAGAGANYLVTGDSGVALFSAAPGVNLTRTYPANAVSGLTGTVITEPGSLVSAAGSIVMDGSQDLRIGGGVALGSGGSLTLSSSSIRLGDGPAGSGLLLSSQELAQFSSADITLNSRGAISFLSPLSLAANNLTLDAASFVSALTDPTASVQLTAQHTLTLQDSTSAASLAPGAAAGGTLQLQADSLVVNSGVINVAGFSQVALNATSSIVGKGTAALNFQGDLAANAPVVTVADDAQLALTSVSGSGNLQFTSTGAAPTENSYLGGALTVSANSILQNGNLLVHGGSISLNATSGVEFGSGSHTSVASTAVAFPGYTALAPAGTISAAVSSGDLRIDAGAILDVSGAQAGGDAGQLAFTSASGALIVSPSAQFLGASAAGPFQPAGFSADVASLSGVSFSDLNGMLNSGSFSGGRAFRFSGAGTSLALDAGAIVNADNFRLVVDDGTINIAGAINVVNPHSAASAYIAASGNVTLASSGSITATSGSTSTLGAEIDLSSEQGGITIQSGAVLGTSAPNATGSRGGGLIHYRLSQGAIAANEFSNAGTVQGSPQQIIEGFQSYRLSDGTVLAQVAASAANPIYAGAVQFMASPGAKALAALGYSVVPGVELDSTGDMEIDSIWNLAGWRFGGAPGYLTLRAGGSINVNASISDGFANATPSSALRSDRSWSINLVAGADLASADLYRVNPTAASGSVVIAPDTLVRTGTGSLSISAAQDIVLSGSVTPDDPYGQGVVYTAGRSAGLELDHVTNPRAPVKYVPIDGGSLTLAAGRDIVGSPTDNEFSQLFVEWYQRQPAQPREAAGTWINYDGFQQNFAAFGGGDLTISAGRDLVRVSGVVPDTARYDATANAEIDYGHGNLSVSAGRDIDSGTFLLSNGVGVIRAGASVTATNQGPFGGPPIGLSLAVMNSSFDVRARGDIVLDTVLNPTLIGQIAPTDAQTDFFLSYSPTASVSLTSLAGNIHLQNASTSLLTADFNQGSILQNTSSDLQIYPATLTAQALRGNLSIEGTMYLAPAANSDLNLVARGNITAGLGIEIAASDIDPASLPGFRNPSLLPSPLFLNAIYTTSGSLAHADPPLHSDASPQAQIVAATGTISGGFWDINQSSFIFAGQDILDLRFNLQNPGPNSVTQVFAGRDIAFADNQSYGIDIQGPGELDVVAGRNIDLGPSFGIVSEGNLVNLGLPAGGANLTVMAGVPPDSAAAPASEPASDHPAALAASVGPTDVSLPGVPTTAQLISLFTLLRDTGRAAVAGQGDFSAGYAAINAMFPPNAAIQGDISMIYSHIYTLDGGDINLVVPHGSVDVGVAQASASVGVQKPPYQLGIVAEQSGSVRALVDGDFLVNSSRVFTLGGGDILIWSSNGSIDAGRGAKTTISAPPPTITIDSQGNVTQNFGAAVAGSGIRGILTVNNVPPGDVDLYAPRGFVIAGDAGIGSAGNITIGAIEVIGANNINFGGTAAGVPVETGGLGASLAGVSSASAGATTAVAESSAGGAQQERAPVADAALSWLDVFITGLGEENCKPDDTDCLKRQQHPAK
ncbi:MAG TPA: filamentous hemagglutinin family protein [Steroidobacteraceae bacterium]|nr:filamentous hemagglutinin family protein [Steroidobacteraceae bacterium]